jgi:three-Cys-motif partner protein
MSQGTRWAIDDHTEGKHLVLKEYLNGWFPILGRWNSRIVFIDGFSGPGEYGGGEKGSPIVALESIEKHKSSGNLGSTEVVCLFIEGRRDRADHLRTLLDGRSNLEGIKIGVRDGTFENNMSEMLDYIGEQNLRMAPAFVMIDPFGVKGSPMALIGRILANAKSECFISFMYEPIRRWHSQPEFEPHLTELFGTENWKQCLSMDEAEGKKRFLHALFKDNLKARGARYVVNFELWKGQRHIYTIYFATGHEKGCNLMKQAIWKVVQNDSFQFRGHNQQQLVLFGPDVDTAPLAAQLKQKFGSTPTPVETIERFVMTDETVFHTGHLRQKTLQPLEKAGRIAVNRPSGVRGFSNGKGITVQFLEKQ